MDLIGVRSIRLPRSRGELWPDAAEPGAAVRGVAAGERLLGGGTWLFSEEQPDLTGLVDLTALGWPAITETETTLSIAATCTIAELVAMASRPDWRAQPLIAQCADSLLASFKIWNQATVGGNLALALPAGSMISLAVALDAQATIWTTDGGERRLPVSELVTGVRQSAITPGEVIRSIEIDLEALRSRTAFRRISLSRFGRSAALVIGRAATDGETILTITAATTRPVQLRFDAPPSAAAVRSAVLDLPPDAWHDDLHGDPDWRRAMTARFAEQIRDELVGGSR